MANQERLQGRHLESVMTVLQERNKDRDPMQVEIEALLRHLHGGGELLDLAAPEEMLEGDADVYAEWMVSFWESYSPTPAGSRRQDASLGASCRGNPEKRDGQPAEGPGYEPGADQPGAAAADGADDRAGAGAGPPHGPGRRPGTGDGGGPFSAPDFESAEHWWDFARWLIGHGVSLGDVLHTEVTTLAHLGQAIVRGKS